jgi:hypothetical protein
MTSADSIASRKSSVRGWMPDAPWPRLAELQRHHQPHDARRQRLPVPAACDSTMLLLQLIQIRGVDAHVGELAETGVDAIHRLAARENPRHRRRTVFDSGAARGVEPRRGATIDARQSTSVVAPGFRVIAIIDLSRYGNAAG